MPGMMNVKYVGCDNIAMDLRGGVKNVGADVISYIQLHQTKK